MSSPRIPGAFIENDPLLILCGCEVLSQHGAQCMRQNDMHTTRSYTMMADTEHRFIVREVVERGGAYTSRCIRDAMDDNTPGYAPGVALPPSGYKELRTSLTGVRWALRLCLSGELGAFTPAQQSILVKSYEAGARAVDAIQDIQDVQRIDLDTLALRCAPFAITDLLEDELFTMAARAEKRGVTMSLDVSLDNRACVMVDRAYIRRVLRHSIENAIVFTQPGGAVCVFVAADDAGEYVRISVTDTGVGVPAHEVERVFSKYVRGRDAALQEPEGLGLGLFLCREVVRRHGGTTRLQSAPGGGTTLSFTLPIVTETGA